MHIMNMIRGEGFCPECAAYIVAAGLALYIVFVAWPEYRRKRRALDDHQTVMRKAFSERNRSEYSHD